MKARTELMQGIAVIIKESGWTQAEAARRCGETQPRMNDLLRGRVSRFSLDALVNIATAIGRKFTWSSRRRRRSAGSRAVLLTRGAATRRPHAEGIGGSWGSFPSI